MAITDPVARLDSRGGRTDPEVSVPTAQALGVPVNLADHFDNRGLSTVASKGEGCFNVWSNTFPAEQLPAPGSEVMVAGTRFAFPAKGSGDADNLRCAGQLVAVPRGRYDWIHLLAAAERRTEDVLYLHFADGSADPEWLRVSDFWPQTPDRFGAQEAFRCTVLHYPRHVQPGMGPVIWRHRVPVPRESDLSAMRLPDNPAIHIFAMTLLSATTPLAAP